MLPASYAVPVAAVLTIGGLLACFAGYRLFRTVLAIYGFLLGAYVASSLVGPTGTTQMVFSALVGGVIGAVVMVLAYFVAVGLIGAGLAALGLNVAWHKFAGVDPPTVVLVIICVLGALAALSIVRYVVVFGTALLGSWTAIIGGLALMGDPAARRATSAGDVWILYPLEPIQGRWWITAGWFALAMVGAAIQLATSRKKRGV